MGLDESILLNESYTLDKRSRNGTTRYSISVDAEPLLLSLSREKIGKPVADAIKEAIQAGIRSITAQAKPATLERRERAKTALAAGKAWALKRYTGGRTAAATPGQTTNLFHDAGRFIAGLVVQQNTTEGTFTINLPANRLDPSTFTPLRFTEMVRRLGELVPALRDPFMIPAVQESIEAVVGDVMIRAIKREQDRTAGLRIQRNQAMAQVLSGFGGLG
jgi:hypothetical protein